MTRASCGALKGSTEPSTVDDRGELLAGRAVDVPEVAADVEGGAHQGTALTSPSVTGRNVGVEGAVGEHVREPAGVLAVDRAEVAAEVPAARAVGHDDRDLAVVDRTGLGCGSPVAPSSTPPGPE